MNQADRDRLKVLHEVAKGHLAQKEAGEQLKPSERWVRKLEHLHESCSLLKASVYGKVCS